MNRTGLTTRYYGGQEAYYPYTKLLIENISILTTAALTVSEKLKLSKVITILANSNVTPNKNITTTIEILAKSNIFQNKNISTTIDILASALTENLSVNEITAWVESNDQNLDPVDYTESEGSLDPTDYNESSNDLGDSIIPDPNYGN